MAGRFWEVIIRSSHHQPTSFTSKQLKMKGFVVFAMVLALAASSPVEDKEKESVAAKAPEGEKKQEKRGLWDLGYGYESHGWDSPKLSHGWDAPKLSHGWEEPHHVHVKKVHVPYPVEVEKHVAVPVKVPYPVTVEKHVPVVVEKKVPVYVEKHVPVHVDRPVPYPVKVPYKVIQKEYVEVPKPYPVHVEKHVPVVVKKPVYVEKHVPVVVKSHGWEPHSHSYSEFHSW
uniref:Uncharacterized protein n=2 Tax=Anopheles atroparvus TaxID=41427 RepID=A0A182J6F8_ANOAO